MSFNFRFSILLAIALCLAACSSNSSSDGAAVKVEASKPAAPTQSQEVTNEAIQNYFRAVAKCVTVDFSFNTSFGSASSAVSEIAQIRQFSRYFTPNAGSNPKNCPFDGGAVFFSEEGDILVEMDFSLKPACQFARLRMNDKYTMHEFSPEGIAFLEQFMGIVNNVGNQGAGQ